MEPCQGRSSLAPSKSQNAPALEKPERMLVDRAIAAGDTRPRGAAGCGLAQPECLGLSHMPSPRPLRNQPQPLAQTFGNLPFSVVCCVKHWTWSSLSRSFSSHTPNEGPLPPRSSSDPAFWRQLQSEPPPGDAYLQGLLIPVHEEGQNGRTAATDAQGGKDQDDRAKLEVNFCKRKERWGGSPEGGMDVSCCKWTGFSGPMVQE